MFELITNSSHDKFKNAWVEIAAVLPNRKVQSCHSVCKRKFNPNNYKGKWSEDEVEFLFDYVETKGRHWEEIGKILGRTALNVRDKFKELGEENHQFRNKKWDFFNKVEPSRNDEVFQAREEVHGCRFYKGLFQ